MDWGRSSDSGKWRTPLRGNCQKLAIHRTRGIKSLSRVTSNVVSSGKPSGTPLCRVNHFSLCAHIKMCSWCKNTITNHDILVFKGIFPLLSSSTDFDPINPGIKKMSSQRVQVLELLADMHDFPWSLHLLWETPDKENSSLRPQGPGPGRQGLCWALTRGLSLKMAGTWD